MKLIFLDFDGVLNSDRFDKATGGLFVPGPDLLDPDAIQWLNRIIDLSGAHVILSTSWRKNFPDKVNEQMLKDKGFRGRVLDSTPMKLSLYERYGEIRMWLSNYYDDVRHGLQHEPIEGMVILDDLTDMGPLAPWHCEIDWLEGLKEEHVQVALDILEKEPWRWTRTN